ncbi:MAG: glycoside hydrolase family 38 C-terminal domain-containing protein [Bacteroidales bacterium]|nr:glycoside hydrolase family 38 C-terminal domain-containing protein [Bacteroidales bacterium]
MQTKTLKTFKERGIKVTTAMQNDVNGIGWSMIDFYKNSGVKYLIMGQHGHRAHIPFDKPTLFWWESPSGNRLLAYRSEHYMHGNVLGLTSGYVENFRSNLSDYLDKLEEKKYPYSSAAIQFSGYIIDNSPPSITACNLVKEWNEKYESPKLRIAVSNEFLNYLEKNDELKIPVIKAAWPDWWSDGCGSAMHEAKVARQTQADMITTTALFSMAKMAGAQLPDNLMMDIKDCYDNLLFYDEHTYGAAESIHEPASENSSIQWSEKAAYVWTARKQASLLREKSLGYLQTYINKSDVPTITVFNTLAKKRSGLIDVFIDHELLPKNIPFKIMDPDGKEVSYQLTKGLSEGSHWSLWAENIPAFGYKQFRIEADNSSRRVNNPVDISLNYENQFYKIHFSQKSGSITSLFDKALSLELLDQHDTLNLGSFLYEQIASRQAMERLTHSNRDTIYVPLQKTMATLSDVKLLSVEDGSIWHSIKFNGKIPVCADKRGVDIEYRIYHKTKRIELIYNMIKRAVTDPESVYIAFPFELQSGNLSFDVQGGIVSPGINQIEGTAADWNTVQGFAAVDNAHARILLNSHDVPLMQFGDINTGRFYYTHKPRTNHIFSWVLNNYWTTNFKASQEGEIRWKYSISSFENTSSLPSTLISQEDRIPMATRVLPSGKTKNQETFKSFLGKAFEQLMLVDAQPSADNKGIILHLKEISGEAVRLDIHKILLQTNASSIKEVNILEEEIQTLNNTFQINCLEVRFIKLEW